MKSQKKQSRRLKIWHGIVVLLVLLFVLFRVWGHHKLQKRLQVLRTQGYPVTLEELEQSRGLPKGARNAADVYLRAFAHYVEWDKEARKPLPIIGKAPLPARTEPLDASTRQLVEKFLSDNEQTLSLLYEAAGVEHCRHKIDFTQRSFPDLPWYDGARSCVRLFSLETLVLCENPDPNGILESIRASLALADSVEVPLLIHHLFHSALRTATYRNIERILNKIPLADTFLLTLSEWLNAYDTDEEFRRTLVGEQCRALHTFQAPIVQIANQSDSNNGFFRLTLVFWKMFGFHDREALEYIDIVRDYFNALDLPDDERLHVFDSIQKDVHGGKRGGLITRMLMPGFAFDLKLGTRDLAHLRVTQTGLAIERYRLAEGRLPKSLKDLVPSYMEAVPVDPFDGRNLKYRTLKPGYVVYSVGDDLTDEGGAERGSQGRDARGKPLPWDITFIVER